VESRSQDAHVTISCNACGHVWTVPKEGSAMAPNQARTRMLHDLRDLLEVLDRRIAQLDLNGEHDLSARVRDLRSDVLDRLETLQGQTPTDPAQSLQTG